MAFEGPKYQDERIYPSFEVRRYAPYLVAETEVMGSREQAGNEGFRRLAGYIFGKNRPWFLRRNEILIEVRGVIGSFDRIGFHRHSRAVRRSTRSHG